MAATTGRGRRRRRWKRLGGGRAAAGCRSRCVSVGPWQATASALRLASYASTSAVRVPAPQLRETFSVPTQWWWRSCAMLCTMSWATPAQRG